MTCSSPTCSAAASSTGTTATAPSPMSPCDVLGRTSFGGHRLPGLRSPQPRPARPLSSSICTPTCGWATDRAHKSLDMALEAEHQEVRDPLWPVLEAGSGRRSSRTGPWNAASASAEDVIFGNVFYRNEGAGKFTEVSERPVWRHFGPGASPPAISTNDGWRGCLPPLRHGLSVLLLAQPPADEPGRRHLPGPGRGPGDRAAAARQQFPEAIGKSAGGCVRRAVRPRRLPQHRPARPGGEQLQRPAVLLQERVPAQELHRLPARPGREKKTTATPSGPWCGCTGAIRS